MSSRFHGLSAHDIIGPLNKREVRTALLDYEIEKSCFRTWDSVERMILRSSDEVKEVLFQCGEAKRVVEEEHHMSGLKRRREARVMSRNVRRRLVNGEEGRDLSKFMILPDAEEERERYKAFYEATSNESLHLEVCPVCAREKMVGHGERTSLLSDMSVAELLVSVTDKGMGVGQMMILRHLLDIDGSDVSCWMCFDCIRALGRGKIPRLSLANDLWIGDVPYELLALTVPEQLLIARYYPRCFIFKLFPRDCEAHLPLDHLYTGMAGNATLFELNTSEVVEMLIGQRMPCPVGTLSSVIAITFVGKKALPVDWLKKTFRVRRGVVHAALVWLRSHNPIYGDIDIDGNRLGELPEDDIPEELLGIIRHEKDESSVERERESYLCADGDDGEIENDGGSSAHVIPIQYVGVHDCEGTKMSINETLLYALANADDDRYGHEGGYAVIHGGQPVPDLPGANKSFDALAAAYPVLWPYGRGLYHDDRCQKLGFQEYIRWTLEYHDKRFRRHHSFPFVAFSIQQKQSALFSARIHMRRNDFEADSDLLADLTLRDLQEAQVDEAAHRPIRNERVQRLQHHLYATSSHIIASGKMRASYRSQIWGSCLWLRPPSLWLTINPLDYEDPIAQIFAGENIDMNSFMDFLGPDGNARSRNMAADPFASASFFQFIIQTTLESLIGIHITKRGVESEMGIFGLVNGYFGVIEAQGRGSLHVHMLLWLKHAPNADEMLDLLMQEEFRRKIATYIDHNIRGHLDGFDEEYVKDHDRERHISFSRPPNPGGSGWRKEVELMERKLARAHQVHVCKQSTCLQKNSKGEFVCKRGAPWPLIERTMVHATGVLDIRRTYRFLNAYCPAILVCLRCNNDLKVVIYGEDTKNIGGYLTNYQNKDPSKSYNMSALLGSALMYHQAHQAHLESVQERNRLLIYRCFNALNRQSELSGPQVMSYLMNWGDRFVSHQYVSVYWGQLAGVLKRTHPSLISGGQSQTDSMQDITVNFGKSSANEMETMMLAGDGEGRLYARRQVDDYAFRGAEFENLGFLNFMVDTYERRIKGETEKLNIDYDDEDGSGRVRWEDRHYLTGHPKSGTHLRVPRMENHNVLPNIVGPWLPRRDGEDCMKEYYYASMLAFLKPWRNLRHLKHDQEPWEEAFNAFLCGASQRDKDVVSGCQYYYESKNVVSHRNVEDKASANDVDDDEEEGRETEDEDGLENAASLSTIDISDEDVIKYEKLQRHDKEYLHGLLGIEAAKLGGIFSGDVATCQWDVKGEIDVKVANDGVNEVLQNWMLQMEKFAACGDERGLESYSNSGTSAAVLPFSDLCENVEGTGKGPHNDMESILATEVNCLNNDQRRGYDIVDWHLHETIAGKKPPQLLMLIPGEGGVGKSKLIQTISQNFDRCGRGEWLVKGAYTGIAASLIDGKTLHVLGGIPVGGRKQSSQTKKRLRKFWSVKHYLVIDEMSMLSKGFFGKLCGIVSTAMEKDEEEIFGGINVILVGDFHQFPPVVCRQSAPLYWPVDSIHDSEENVIGRKIYEQFTTVVQLKEQIRVRDPIWHIVLQHVRYGNCQREHIEEIKKLILTERDCPTTDYDAFPWKNARLVTPRHGVRVLWNSAAIRKHCVDTGRRLYICTALDMVDGQSVTNKQKIAIITHTKGSRNQFERAGLMKEVELAIGAPVMVTLNILTDLDVANGVRGEIEEIIVDERDQENVMKNSYTTRLKYPPRYVLVKLTRTKAPPLHDLPQNVIPIMPVTKTFTINEDGVKVSVNRTQLPLTLGYAFTDYRSQGQTLEPVVVDIGPPPYGHLTPFNIYVALSRGTGRNNIRLLREFDEKLLQQHPSEFLRLEDERLQKMNDSTRKIWQIRGNYIV